ncbi:hypothetical protein L596_018587 [Steinernema carpocapsae]|uniref:Actin-related protein 2/3 complex subunit n=2 Tax=Steinernema carpocapsae TaxID=34508 RepID=A0A4U5N543_STECR|nr:hypothetical protein L596_018587 [Steinernema carpocapsae]
MNNPCGRPSPPYRLSPDQLRSADVPSPVKMVGTLPVEHWNLGIGPINCHSWNKDRTQLAVSASSNEIYIFQWSGQWKQTHVLAEHDLPITGIDWAPESNRIVSCSQDKNAFVWTFENGTWKPALVLVRISKAATSVKWSPRENKFAVGSGSKLVSVCYYEKENDWWVAKQIKKPIRSTVTCIDWHPNNVLIGVGACDFKARVYSAYVKEVDDKPGPNPWGTRLPFGNLLAELPSLGWVHNVSFSPSGLRLAWVAHDSSLSMVDANVNIDDISTLRTKFLPFNAVKWVSENSIIAAGHDCSPMLFNIINGKLQFSCKLDIPSENKSSNVNSAFQKFRNFDRNAVNETVNVQLKTLHQNAITQILTHSGRSDNVQKFTTCGIDGLIALWDLKGTIDYCARREESLNGSLDEVDS